MQELETLKVICEALGDNPTIEQQEYVTSWIMRNIPQAYLDDAKYIAINCDNVFTDISMRQGEMGIY